ETDSRPGEPGLMRGRRPRRRMKTMNLNQRLAKWEDEGEFEERVECEARRLSALTPWELRVLWERAFVSRDEEMVGVEEEDRKSFDVWSAAIAELLEMAAIAEVLETKHPGGHYSA